MAAPDIIKISNVATLATSIFLLMSACLTPLMVAVLTFINQRAAKKAADKAEEVKATLAANTAASVAQIQKIAVVAEKTHILVNSQMGRQLTLYAVAARRLAEQTDNPEDIAAAEGAERELREHQAKQKTVDELNACDAH